MVLEDLKGHKKMSPWRLIEPPQAGQDRHMVERIDFKIRQTRIQFLALRFTDPVNLKPYLASFPKSSVLNLSTEF